MRLTMSDDLAIALGLIPMHSPRARTFTTLDVYLVQTEKMTYIWPIIKEDLSLI